MRPAKRVEKYTVLAPDGSILREESFIPEVRHEELPSFNIRKIIQEKEEETFDRDKTLFKAWIKDTSASLKQCYTNDFSYWKAPKFIKDLDDLERVKDIIIENYADIKKIFTTLLSSDGFPNIGLNEFTTFAKQANILDGTIPMATLDRMFIAVNVGDKGSNANSLQRPDFLEILVRVGYAKFKETGRASNYSESLRMLLHDIKGSYTPRPWQEFREEWLWNNETDKTFKANLENLQKVHEWLHPKHDKGYALRETIDLIVRGSSI